MLISLSPAEQIAQLRSMVDALYLQGTLNTGVTDSLVEKLDHALSAVIQGKTKNGYNLLAAFRNEASAVLKTQAGSVLSTTELLLQSLSITEE